MGNSVVTVMCTAAICCEIEHRPDWAGGILVVAFALGVYNNIQWGRVFKAVATIMASRK